MTDKVLMNGRVTTRKQRAIETFKMSLIGFGGMIALFIVWWFR